MTGGRSDSGRGESDERTDEWVRPSRRAVLGGLAAGGLAAGGLTVGSAGAQFGSTGPSTPTVEGPIEGGSQTGRPLTAAPHDFESAGYVEEEYFISGEAEALGGGGLLGSIGGDSGSDSDTSGPAEYKTRILVYRPENAADFNGGVLVEWFNVSLQTDFPVAWPNAYDYLQRNGWAVVLVSAQKVGVDNSSEDMDLVTWDPERYGDLSHPGDDYALDIFAQAIQAVRQGGDDGGLTDGTSGGLWSSDDGSSDSGTSGGLWGSDDDSSDSGTSGGWFGASFALGQLSGGSGGWFGSDSGGSSSDDSGGSWWGSGGSGGSSGDTGGTGDDPHPLGGLDAEYVIATGQSQSSFYINSFISDVEPDYDIVDGFLPAAGMPVGLSTDVDPTIWLNTQSEAAGNLADAGEDLPGNESLPEIPPELLESLFGGGPPEDENQFRFWEIAGAAHVNQWLSFWAGAARRRDFGADAPPWDPDTAANYGELEEGNYGVCEYNYFPARYTYAAAIEALRAWIQEGTPAPSAPRMERTEGENGTSVVKDEYGNAVGGIRLPPIDVPVATYETTCGLTGKTTRFGQSQLDSLYPTHDGYVSEFEAAAQQAVQDGFLLQDGADELVARAEASSIGE